MSLDASICAKKPIICPDCQKIVWYEDLGNTLDTGGHCLRDALTQIGYGDQQYGMWVQLSPEQATTFAKACVREDRYNASEIEQLVAYAIYKGYQIFLEADW